jgi:predicted MFS family arabinose efflux permease
MRARPGADPPAGSHLLFYFSTSGTAVFMNSKITKARVALSSIFFLYGTTFACWASRIPDVKRVFDLSNAQLGGILLWMPGGSLLSLLASGFLITRYKSRHVIVAALCLYSLVFSCLGLVHSVLILTVSLFLFGFFGNLLNVSINTQAVGIEKMTNRTIMASFHAIFSAGFMLGAAVGGVLVKAGVSPFAHFTIFAAVNVLCLLISSGFLLPKDEQAQSPRLAFHFSDKSLWVLGLMVFCGVLSEGAMIDWSAIYYGQYVENSEADASAAFTVFSFAMMMGRFAGDWLVNRYGAYTVQVANGLLLVTGMLFSISLTNAPGVYLGYTLIGLGVANIVPLTYSLAGKLTTLPSAIALASIATIGFLGFLLGPALIGLLAGLVSLRFALSIVILLGFTIALLSLKFRREFSKKRVPEAVATVP